MSPVRLSVHVTPRAGKDEVMGWRGAELAVRVAAAPESGKANEAVCRLVAGAVGVPKSSVRVVRGQSSRHKSLELDAEDSAVCSAFGEPPEGLF